MPPSRRELIRYGVIRPTYDDLLDSLREIEGALQRSYSIDVVNSLVEEFNKTAATVESRGSSTGDTLAGGGAERLPECVLQGRVPLPFLGTALRQGRIKASRWNASLRWDVSLRLADLLQGGRGEPPQPTRPSAPPSFGQPPMPPPTPPTRRQAPVVQGFDRFGIYLEISF